MRPANWNAVLNAISTPGKTPIAAKRTTSQAKPSVLTTLIRLKDIRQDVITVRLRSISNEISPFPKIHKPMFVGQLQFGHWTNPRYSIQLIYMVTYWIRTLRIFVLIR
jgi:hypothetical protein